MTISRRGLFRGLAGLALLTAGCACPAKRRSVVEWTEPMGLEPLVPELIQKKDLPLAFDTHAHLFNATDLHVRGFLQESVAHSLSEPWGKLLISLAPLIEKIGQARAISCGAEMEALASLLWSSKGKSSQSAHEELKGRIMQDVETYRENVVDDFVRHVPGSEFGRELDEIYYAYHEKVEKSPSGKGFPQDSVPVSTDVEFLRRFFKSGGRSTEKAMGLDGVGPFAITLTSPRHHNLISFQSAYSSSSRAFGIDACFPALVDFDYWLGCSTTQSSLLDQVLLHEQLAVLSGGYVLPLVAYNPLSDIRERNQSFELVRSAITVHGFVGVKIYPPIGYLPIGNSARTDRDLKDNDLTREEAYQLDERLCMLYRFCEAWKIPLMAHTAHANGRNKDHDDFGGPKHWVTVVEKFPGLKVIAAHFGGSYFKSSPLTYWPQEFSNLMFSRHGQNLYADLGDSTELLNGSSSEAKRMRLLLQDQPRIMERLMYGSDWHMLVRESGWEDYTKRLDEFIASASVTHLEAVRRAFYYENAVNVFGLNSLDSNSNRTRLEAFYSKWKVPTPHWLKVISQKWQ